MITRSDVDAAVARIAGWVRTTPVLTVEPGPFGAGVLLKCEYTQHTGSFKARGAFNRILTAAEAGASPKRAVAGNGGASADATIAAGVTGVAVASGIDAGPGVAGMAPADGWRGAGPAAGGEGSAKARGADGSGGDASPTGAGPAADAEDSAKAASEPTPRDDGSAAEGSGGDASPTGASPAADALGLDGALSEAGVVAASGGNAGLAVAYAAAQLEIPATVYVPVTAPAIKVDKLRALGAVVHQVGTEFAQANEAALAHAAETGALFCHAYDQPEIVAGQGSLAVELLDQAPEVDTVLVSVGGGGLAGGIAAGLDGRAKLVAVEPQTIPTLHIALAKGAPVDVAVSGVAADSLGARRIGDIAFDLAVKHKVHSILVDDASIIAARKLLWDKLRIVVEHGTAAALAALTTGAYRPAPDETVAVVLCGANTDPSDITG